jgi:hypothetical protein
VGSLASGLELRSVAELSGATEAGGVCGSAASPAHPKIQCQILFKRAVLAKLV